MAVTLDQNDDQALIQLEGEVSLSSAAELRKLLLEALAFGKKLRVDLEQTSELSVTALQLFWAAEREARASGLDIALVGQLPEGVSAALNDVGFDKFPIPLESKEGLRRGSDVTR